MPNYSNSTLNDLTFQRNDRVGRSWRKRYVKENGGDFVQSGDTWTWGDGTPAKVFAPKKISPRKVVKNEDI